MNWPAIGGHVCTGNVRRGKSSSSDENETTGLLRPPDAAGNIPRSPSSDAVEKVRQPILQRLFVASMKAKGKGVR